MKLLEELYHLSCTSGDGVIFEDEINGSISYREFEIATGKLFRALTLRAVPKERIVAIRVKRSYRTFIAIAGALKAAVPYVVIGDTSPKEYVKQVYAECEPFFTLDDAFLDDALRMEYLEGFRPRDCHDLALVVYSTGSSGFFKGSMHEYGAIEQSFERSLWGRELHTAAAEALVYGSIFFLAGFYGEYSIATLVDVVVYRTKAVIIRTEYANNVDYLVKMARQKNVYTMDANPMTLPQLVKQPASCIKEYYVCYEMFPCQYSPDYKIYNSYGLTEAFGTLCFKEVEKDYEITPAGAPVPGADVKLLDRENRVTERNEIGELVFVPQYFRGYIKRTDLFRQAYHDGYFYTGDMGFYNENDDIVIVGRKRDLRETANGYIVPVYIVNAIKKAFPDISDCHVKLFDAPLTVAAYYLSEKAHSAAEINDKIKNMIPTDSLLTHAVRLDKLEYFFSGKINRNLYIRPE